ncbi:hypothetical protein L210DRAFT_3203324 [Boletus edulis BED1]|uniref:C2H2-type domain-containing protein n=1 Tax=Boletus edulis BED1 TaxID=1328754 RepID=A0AAD4BX22_BOLED|nr:hypothetical protein L210DRAFT_3203324 [Boletus edulis BED1]
MEPELEAPGYKDAPWKVSETQNSPFGPTTPRKYSFKLTEMNFNDGFNEDDSCELVAIGLGLKQYYCGWTTNGVPCNTALLGQDVPLHLKTAHGANDTPRIECSWGNCGEVLNKGCLVRHVQEKHLEYRWPCPRCGAVFSRRGVMDTHRATCTA